MGIIHSVTGKYKNMNLFTVSKHGGLLVFPVNDIIRLQASSNYTYIFFANNKKLLSAKVLHNFEEQLIPAGFIRIHNSHLVNKDYIKRIDTSGNVYLNDDTIINIARRRRKQVIQYLKGATIDNNILAA